jgi:DnaK suppressor protein
MPQKEWWAMTHHLDLQTIRESLAQQRAALLKHIQGEEARLRSRVGANPDVFDLAQEYASRWQISALTAQARQHLEQIEAALRCLDEGTYGMCAECGEAIPLARLRVLPYACLCIRCQEQQERKEVSL